MGIPNARRRESLVYRVPMRQPDDVSGLEALYAAGDLAPSEVVAILGKTEGNGCVNDFTRAFATETLKNHLAERLGADPAAIARRVPMVMSGGTEGGLAPHFLILGVRPANGHNGLNGSAGGRLAIGTAFTRAFNPEEIGRMAQVRATADAVAEAMAQADIHAADDVHFVQVKCPLLTSERVADACRRGKSVVTEDSYASMGYSRGASALGVALALGEVEAGAIRDEVVCRDLNLWSARASASAGVELVRNEIIVLGNSDAWGGQHVIARGVMRDAIDLPAIRGVLRSLGFDPADQLGADEAERVTAVLVKADPSRNGRIRSARHIMWDDSDIHATRHARALVGGVVAAAVGRTELFVSGGAEHQGPDGGGPIAVVATITAG